MGKSVPPTTHIKETNTLGSSDLSQICSTLGTGRERNAFMEYGSSEVIPQPENFYGLVRIFSAGSADGPEAFSQCWRMGKKDGFGSCPLSLSILTRG